MQFCMGPTLTGPFPLACPVSGFPMRFGFHGNDHPSLEIDTPPSTSMMGTPSPRPTAVSPRASGRTLMDRTVRNSTPYLAANSNLWPFRSLCDEAGKEFVPVFN